MKKAVRSLSNANNHFATTLHKSFASEEGNIFFSPFSISTALAMLLNGARGDTAKEMRHVLGYDIVNLSDHKVHKSIGNLLTTMSDNPDVYSLAIANALLTQKDFPFLSQYKEDLKKIYRAEAREVDFVKECDKVVIEINEWVKENTKHMILRIFDSLDSSSVMVLLNAVYFKDTWENPFDPESTTPIPFYNNRLEAKVKEVSMMYTENYFGFFENDTFKALELPYKGENITMLLMLPNEKTGLKQLENILTLDIINDVKGSLECQNVQVTIPKFHLEFTKELNEFLQKLGIRSVFSDKANLKGLSKSEQLLVFLILHKAVVDVNEEGTEAAAVTAISVSCCSSISNNLVTFIADHPFIFCIVDKRSDLILFMGRVQEL